MAPALHIRPRVVAVPYNQAYDFPRESAWDVTLAGIYEVYKQSHIIHTRFHHPWSLSQIYGKNSNFQSFLDLEMVNKRLCITLTYTHTHTYIYISKELQMRSMTAESFTFFTFTFFLYFFPVWTGANHITQGIFAATKKGINVELTKRWTVTKCYKYSV